MADVEVTGDTTSVTTERWSGRGPYWTSPSVGYIVVTGSTSAIDVYKTTDSGATWAAQDTANNPASSNNRSIGAWWDKETKDNSGTLLYIAWVQTTDSAVHYIQFNTSDDTYGTDRTIDSLTISSTSSSSDVSVVVAKSGRVYVCARGDFAADTEDTDHSMRSSSDGFATNNVSETSPYSADEEVVVLLPGSDADMDDISAVVFDAVNQDLEFWKYDESAGTWGVTTIDASISVVASSARLYKGIFSAVSRHSDEAILVAYWNDFIATTADFRSAEILQATPTITQKTNIDTNTDNSAQVGLLINQQNDDVYVAYLGSDAGDEAWGSALICYFKLSTDDMDTWGTEQTYGVQNDDLRAVALGQTVGNDGGRVMPCWFNHDLTSIHVDDGNDVEIAAAGGVTTRRYTLTLTGVG